MPLPLPTTRAHTTHTHARAPWVLPLGLQARLQDSESLSVQAMEGVRQEAAAASASAGGQLRMLAGLLQALDQG